MRAFRILLRHELSTLLLSTGTYVAAVLFLVVMGFLFAAMVSAFMSEAQEAPPQAVFFRYFIVPVLFLVPLLTMRSIAEERRSGTLETLLTAPVPTGAVVAAKFSAAFILYAVLWILTFSFQIVLYNLVRDPRLLEPGPILSGYLFILTSGAAFTAVGILASALCRSQLVAAIMTFTALFLLLVGTTFGIQELSTRPSSTLLPWLRAVDLIGHADGFNRGLVDMRPLGLYITATLLLLFVATLVVEGRAGRR
jgi:ABC-2 type transport system permease protein